MRTHLRQLLLILSLAGLIAPAVAFWSKPEPPSNIYFFGDSTTDSGNACNANTLDIDIPSFPYPHIACAFPIEDGKWYDKRASNGEVWAEHFASKLVMRLGNNELSYGAMAALASAEIAPANNLSGLENYEILQLLLPEETHLVPEYYDGRIGGNYATSGLEATELILELLVYQEFMDPSKVADIWERWSLFNQGQLELRDLQLDLSVDPAALYVFWVGGNDIRRERDIPSAVASVVLAIEAIASQGAQVMVAMLPDTGRSYDFNAEEKQQATAKTLEFNFLLTAAVAAINADPANTDILLFNTHTLIEKIAAQPAAFGLDEAVEPYLVACGVSNTGDVESDLKECVNDQYCDAGSFIGGIFGKLSACDKEPNKYLLFDHIHMTTAGHNLVATCAADLIAPKYFPDYPWFRLGIPSCNRVFASSPMLSYLGYWPSALQTLRSRYGMQDFAQFLALWQQFNPATQGN